MGYTMYITERSDEYGFDVSTLAYNIEHTTSLLAQPGKLTFSLLKEPEDSASGFYVEPGMRVKFWNAEVPVFSGYIFTIKTNRSGNFDITAYDNLRYLQNHDSRCIAEAEYSLKDVFVELCESLQLDWRILGHAAEETAKLHKHAWLDKPIFEMISDCMEEMNIRSVAEKVADKNGRYLDDKGTRYNEYFDELNLLKPPVKYFIRDNFGVVELNDIENNVKYRISGVNEKATVQWSDAMSVESANVEGEAVLNPLIIGDGSLLTNYEYEIDIDKNTFNEIIFMESGNNEKAKKNSTGVSEGWRERIREASATDADLIYAYAEWKAGRYTPGTVTKQEFERLRREGKIDKKTSKTPAAAMSQDKDAIEKWGTLRQIRSINSGYTKRQLEEYVKLTLQESDRVKKTLKIEALGVAGMDAGDGFYLELKELGLVGDAGKMMYVVSATHHYGTDLHTMSLDVCTPDALTEIL